MFCSATPTLKKRFGKVSENGSRARKPRSAVSRTILGSLAASSVRVRTKALRMLSVPDLGDRGGIFLIVHGHVVPADLVFHERDTLAECRSRNQDVGTPRRQARNDSGHRRRVMTRHDVDVPVEGLPPVLDGLE